MPITNADIERRLAALEQDMALVKQEQSHARELTTAHFKTLEAGMDRLLVRFDAFAARYDVEHSDPSKSAAGRELITRLEGLEEAQEAAEPVLESAKFASRVFLWVTGGSLLAAVASALAILKATGLI